MEERRRWTSTAAAFAVLSLVGAAQAQTSSRKEVNFDKVWGAPYVNGFIHADAGAGLVHEPYTAADGSAQDVYELIGSAHANGGLNLLSKRIDAFRFEAEARVKDDTARARVVDVSTHGLMRIGGRTVLSFDRGWPLQDRQSFGPFSLLDGKVDAKIPLLIFSIAIRGDAAGALEGEASTRMNRSEQGGSAGIGLRARQYALLQAGVQIWKVEGGVEGSLNLPVAAARATLRADLQDGPRGELVYAVDPISIVARVYGCIDLGWVLGRHCGSFKFLDWSSPAQRGRLPLK
jgi:hypothetical protein